MPFADHVPVEDVRPIWRWVQYLPFTGTVTPEAPPLLWAIEDPPGMTKLSAVANLVILSVERILIVSAADGYVEGSVIVVAKWRIRRGKSLKPIELCWLQVYSNLT